MKWWLTLFFILMGLVCAEVQPEFPELDLPERYAVILKGRPVSKLFWRGGRPFGTLEELGPRLNLPSDSSVEVDILAIVAEKGYTAELADGILTLAEGRPEYVPPPAWAANEPVRRPKPSQPTGSGSKRAGPDLTYYVKSYTADTGYVRAKVLVVNEGDGPSQPTRARAYFTDWFGKAFASDWRPIPALEPGESTSVMEFFSMVTEQEANEKSMNYQVEIRFDGVVDPRTGRTNSSQTKKSKLQQQMKVDKAKPTWSIPKNTGTP